MERAEHAASPAVTTFVARRDTTRGATQVELARFYRTQAEECLRLAAAAKEPAAAAELVLMAASLHERAIKLEIDSREHAA